ncbi:hypothetical protein VCHENC02_2407, partial [Vibrio harveyi]
MFSAYGPSDYSPETHDLRQKMGKFLTRSQFFLIFIKLF